MAKIIAPPQINDLSELLDVLVHTDKYVGYLKQMEAMRDAITELLGTLKTREQAEELMYAAQRKHAEAEAVLDVAEEEVKKLHLALDARQADLDKQEQEFAAEQDAAKKALDLERKQAAESQRALNVQAQEQAKKDQNLRAWEGSLKAIAKSLEDKEGKLNKLKQAMGEAGI